MGLPGRVGATDGTPCFIVHRGPRPYRPPATGHRPCAPTGHSHPPEANCMRHCRCNCSCNCRVGPAMTWLCRINDSLKRHCSCNDFIAGSLQGALQVVAGRCRSLQVVAGRCRWQRRVPAPLSVRTPPTPVRTLLPPYPVRSPHFLPIAFWKSLSQPGPFPSQNTAARLCALCAFAHRAQSFPRFWRDGQRFEREEGSLAGDFRKGSASLRGGWAGGLGQ